MKKSSILIAGIMLMFSACAGQKIESYSETKPDFDLQSYFNGPIKAWGIVQDRSGKVTRRFDVTMVGSWEGDTGTLKENFVYYDGKTQERTWTIKRLSQSNYEGTAGDIVGTAQGKVAGSAMRWDYQMDLSVDGSVYRITFDDWMFLMNDGVLINRSYLKKFGLTVGELTLFMQKQ